MMRKDSSRAATMASRYPAGLGSDNGLGDCVVVSMEHPLDVEASTGR